MMNLLIEEFAIQCRTYKLYDDAARVDFDYKKFAELIVYRMLDITDAHTEVFQTDRDEALVKHSKQSIKEHFGVE